MTATGLDHTTTESINEHSHWQNGWPVLWVLICAVSFTVCSYHVIYAFQSEFTLYKCLNVNEILPQSKRQFWILNGCNCTRTHNLLVHKQTLNHLAKPAKWLGCVVSTYLNGKCDCIFFLSYDVRISEWNHTL